jgi:sugar phosphate isomerase/epimerase
MSDPTRRGIVQSIGLAGLAAAFAPRSARAVDAPAPAPSGSSAAAPKFKLGLISYMVGAKWDLPTLLKVCKTVGIASLELRTTHAHGVEPTLSRDQRKDVRKRFEDSGVVLWGFGSTCEFHSPDQKVVEKNIETCKQFLQLAADVGATGVKIRPNALPKGVPPEKTVEQIGKALSVCGETAQSLGREVWAEVHGNGTQMPPVMKSIMEHCGHKSVGVTWNSNGEDVEGGSIAKSFELLRPWIRSCHINDLWKDSTGAYPYRELLRRLNDAGYDRYTMCEVPYQPADVAAGETFLRYYKARWMELTGATSR